jgi:hypothetical protein
VRWPAPRSFVMRSEGMNPGALGGAACCASRRPRCLSTGLRSDCSSMRMEMGKYSLQSNNAHIIFTVKLWKNKVTV